MKTFTCSLLSGLFLTALVFVPGGLLACDDHDAGKDGMKKSEMPTEKPMKDDKGMVPKDSSKPLPDNKDKMQ